MTTTSLDDEIAAWKQEAAGHFANKAGLDYAEAEKHAEAAWANALELVMGDAAQAVLLDPIEQVDEELSNWTD